MRLLPRDINYHHRLYFYGALQVVVEVEHVPGCGHCGTTCPRSPASSTRWAACLGPRACPGTGGHRAARGGRPVQHRNGSPGLHNLHDHLFFTDLEFESHSFSNIHHTVLLLVHTKLKQCLST